MRCPKCGQENANDRTLCIYCGLPLPHESPAGLLDQLPQAERRQVTILFADLSGFTALASQMDPEHLARLLGECLETLSASVYHFDGVVDKFVGDRIMALFGAPVAHENDPALAIHCARDMMERLAAFNQSQQTIPAEESPPALSLHIGINTGEVLAGTMGPEGARQYTVIGDAANLASRLSDQAGPGEIWVGPDTYELTARLFHYQALAPIRVKGKTDPVSAYQVVGERAGPTQARGFEGLDIPLQGRRGEQVAFQTAIAALLNGRGGIISVVGEAGIGKSRLVTEVRTWAQKTYPDALDWHEGRGLPHGLAATYAPILEIVQSLLGLPTAAPTSLDLLLRHRESDLFPEGEGDLTPLATFFAPHLAEEEDPRYPKARTRRERAVLSLHELISGIAQRRPLVLVIDDLHWADSSSAEIFQGLMALTVEQPLLLVGVCRHQQGDACWAWREEARRRYGDRYTQLTLSPLSSEESLELLSSILGEEVLAEEVKAAVLPRAEGNPLFLEEVVRTWMQSGLLAQREGRWHMRGSVPRDDIPQTLQGVIQARLDRLPPAARYILQAAAVVGRIFHLEDLQAALEDTADLQQHLWMAEGAGLIRRRETPGLYIFKHALTQEVAYRTLLIEERKRLHQRLAHDLEARHTGRLEESADLLAYHFDRAALWPEAFRYHLLAGNRARSLYANREAMAHYCRALEIAAQDPQAGDDEQQIALWESLGDVQAFVGQYDQALQSYQAGLASCPQERRQALLYWRIGQVHERKGETDQALTYLRQALDMLGPQERSPEVVSVRTGLGWAHYYHGAYDQALQEGLAGLEIAQEQGYRRPLGDLLTLVAISLYEKGAYDRAESYCRQGLAISQAEGWDYELARLYSTLGTIAHGRGDYDRAIENHRNSLVTRQRIGDRRGIGIAYNNLSTALFEAGRHQEALETLRLSLGIWEELGDPLGQAIAHNNIGLFLCTLEQWKEARLSLERSYQISQEMTSKIVLPETLAGLAWVDLEEDRLASAQERAQASRDLAQEMGSRYEEAVAYQLLGRIAARCDHWAESERCFETSIDLLHELGSCHEEGRSHYYYALALAQHGPAEGGAADRAAEELARADEQFALLGLDWERRRVQEARKALEG